MLCLSDKHVLSVNKALVQSLAQIRKQEEEEYKGKKEKRKERSRERNKKDLASYTS